MGDWLTATATILAAVIALVGGYFLGRIARERKSARFVANAPEDLAKALRTHGDFEVKFKDFSTQELIVAGVTVHNSGNVVINGFKFSISIPGMRKLALAQAVSDNGTLTSSIQISSEGQLPKTHPTFEITVPFFNVGESFKISTFFDGQPSVCEVSCRLSGVSVEVLTPAELKKIARIRVVLNFVLAMIVGAVVSFVPPILYAIYKDHQLAATKNSDTIPTEKRTASPPQDQVDKK